MARSATATRSLMMEGEGRGCWPDWKRTYSESTLLEYVRFQSGQQPRPSPSIINDRVAVADRAIRNEFPDAPCQIARGFHHAFLRRKPMGPWPAASSDEPAAREGPQTQHCAALRE